MYVFTCRHTFTGVFWQQSFISKLKWKLKQTQPLNNDNQFS